MHNTTMQNELNCPHCGATLKDWREFVVKNPQYALEGEKERPFECTGRTCGKRWALDEIWQARVKQE